MKRRMNDLTPTSLGQSLFAPVSALGPPPPASRARAKANADTVSRKRAFSSRSWESMPARLSAFVSVACMAIPGASPALAKPLSPALPGSWPLADMGWAELSQSLPDWAGEVPFPGRIAGRAVSGIAASCWDVTGLSADGPMFPKLDTGVRFPSRAPTFGPGTS